MYVMHSSNQAAKSMQMNASRGRHSGPEIRIFPVKVEELVDVSALVSATPHVFGCLTRHRRLAQQFVTFCYCHNFNLSLRQQVLILAALQKALEHIYPCSTYRG